VCEILGNTGNTSIADTGRFWKNTGITSIADTGRFWKILVISVWEDKSY
jgi:hypothetical protein